jgi:glycine betaine/proline transport system permease protein
MAGFSMVVIAAMVGGMEDIGLEVFNTMKKAQFGESLLAGMVIALLAMIMDRISRGFAQRRQDPRVIAREPAQRRTIIWIMGGTVVALSLLAEALPGLRDYPAAWVFYPAEALNTALEWFIVNFFWLTSTLKTWAIFFLLLPFKLGLEQTVRPRYWGFELDATAKVLYVLIILALALAAARAAGWRAAVGVSIVGLLYYFGTTGIPWVAFSLLVATLAYQTGGLRTCGLVAASLCFIAFTGVWSAAMESVQLCGAAVIVSFLLGSSLGIWAALNDRVSAFLRPINDTLQTMPIFVFLIPAVMVFLVGEFTAFIAIIMYATVPSIRYTEHGIRNIPAPVVEAARSFGATRFQLLWQAQLPMALPEIILGLNQTIMMGLAMVIVAALVGAKGLGTEVMVALTWADTGKGVVSGLSVALIAIIADRIIQSWCARKKRALGLD